MLDNIENGATLDTGRLREIVLVRIACALRGVTRGTIAADLAPFAGHAFSKAGWQALIGREVDGLLAAALVRPVAKRVEATDAGIARATAFLGIRTGRMPRIWSDVCNLRLVAKALGCEGENLKKLGALMTPEGLRAAILVHGYRLKIKGLATPTRLRSALAAHALARAFGDKLPATLARKSGLTAKASRLLAAQLSSAPRDFGTDARLVAALAAEHVGAASADLDTLRAAVLHRFVQATAAAAPPIVRPALRPTPASRPAAPAAAPAIGDRPDLSGFASEVRRHAASYAQGWAGNRRAYISHVWRGISQKRPDWGLSEIEFKCMLAEAHGAGELELTHADLKDEDQDVLRQSKVVFKNAVFHFIRVDR
ncbi:MAG TPA: hypothetical protein VG900_02750 [Hyphomicrobiaceae bacterium]|nr:hypothetical protein [Hyphomicrobiaceae bacterium]